MLKIFIAIAIFGSFAYCDNLDKNAELRSYKNDAADGDGNFNYAYETSNGIQVQAAGNAAGIRGALNYISPEGERIALQYTADEDGYHPVGDHLPTPPPIPAYVLRALEYIREHPPPTLKQHELQQQKQQQQ